VTGDADRSAILSPLRDSSWPVWLSLDGVSRCRIALEQLIRAARASNGGATPSRAVLDLLTVLQVAEAEATAEPEPSSAGSSFRVVMRAAEARGSAEGSAVAAAAHCPAVSARQVWLGTRAAAQQLGISDRMVRRAASMGWIRAARVRGAWRIAESEVLAYAERQAKRKAVQDGRESRPAHQRHGERLAGFGQALGIAAAQDPGGGRGRR